MVIVLLSQYSPIGIIPTAKALHCKLETMEAKGGLGGRGGGVHKGGCVGITKGACRKGRERRGMLCRNDRVAALLQRWSLSKALH